MTVNPRTVNVVTRWVVIGPLVLWAAWELVVLALRTRVPGVRTISMEARSIASRGMPSIAYALTGMCAHWFVNWKRLPLTDWASTVGAVIWWAGLAAYLISDAIAPEARTWMRQPIVAALLGGVGAWLLFGQQAVWSK